MRSFINLLALILTGLVSFSQGEFIKNEGQLSYFNGDKVDNVLFYHKGKGLDVYFTQKGVSYYFSKTNYEIKTKFESKQEEEKYFQEILKDSTFYYRLDMNFIDGKDAPIVLSDKIEGFYYNFYTPICPNGILNVEASDKITYKNVYSNIDFVFYFKNGTLKYDIVLNEGANINDISLEFDGASDMKIIDNEIIFNSPVGVIKESLPESFLQLEDIKIDKKVSYKLNENVVKFDLNYNNSHKLIIDPQITWSTYYGVYQYLSSTTEVKGNQLVISGNAYSSNSIPLLNPGGGAYFQNTQGGGIDMYILKFDTNGVRQWATYYGGNANDMGYYDIEINSTGDIYVAGTSQSTNMPTQNPGGGAYYDGTYNQGAGPFNPTGWNYSATFIARFNSLGVRQWATHYDYVEYPALTIDNNDNLYLVGHSQYENPSVQSLSGAYNQATVTQRSYITNPSANNASSDMFIIKFNSSNQRVWATNLGGNTDEGAWDITTDNANNFYIYGSVTVSNGTTTGFVKSNPGGGAYYNGTTLNTTGTDLLLYKFSPTGSLLWGTVFGGSAADGGNAEITIDGNNNITIGGYTRSTDIPFVNPGGGALFDNTINHTGPSSYSYFLARFNSSLQLTWSTYYYSNIISGNFPMFLETTSDNRLIVVAHDGGNNLFPLTPLAGSYNQSMINSEVFIGEFNSNLSLNWGTYLGSQASDFIQGMELTSSADYSLFIVGGGYGTLGYPLVNPGGGAYFDNMDSIKMFITKFSPVSCDTTTNTTNTAAICETGTKALIGTPSGGVWSVVSGGGSISGTTYTPANISSNTSVTVRYKIIGSGGCPDDSTDVTFTVNVMDSANNTMPTTDICVGGSRPVTGTPSGGTWSEIGAGNIITGSYIPPNLLPGSSVSVSTIYTIAANGACPSTADTVSFMVVRDSTVIATSSASSMCLVDTCTVNGTPNGGTWNVLSGSGTIVGGVLTPSAAGLIRIEYAVTGFCGNGADTIDIVINPTPNANAGLDENICLGDTVTLTATGGGTYQWTPGPAGASNQVYPTVTTGYRVDITSDSGCIASDSITVFVQSTGTAIAQNDQAVVATGVQETIDVYTNDVGGINTIQILSGPSHGTATVNGGNVLYSSSLGYIGNDTLVYEICDANCGVICDTAIVVIVVENDLTIPIGVSVNGDGKNDVFNILGLSRYPHNSIQIFNRWGSLIFEANPYLNDWAGQSTANSLLGEEVIEGTYFYILKLGDNLPSYNGYIELKK